MKIEAGQKYKDQGNPGRKFTVIGLHGRKVWVLYDAGQYGTLDIEYFGG